MKYILSILTILFFISCENNIFNEETSEIYYKKGGKSAKTLSTDNELSSDDTITESDYPMSVSFEVAFHKKHKQYMNDGATLQNGSIISLAYAALTPPADHPYGKPVTITFSADTLNGEMIYSFGPSGCTFDPPLRVVMNYKDLQGEGEAELFYISENGEYIEQEPDDANSFNQWMTIYIDHFSRYAMAYGR